jgi:hypothetical protein
MTPKPTSTPTKRPARANPPAEPEPSQGSYLFWLQSQEKEVDQIAAKLKELSGIEEQMANSHDTMLYMTAAVRLLWKSHRNRLRREALLLAELGRPARDMEALAKEEKVKIKQKMDEVQKAVNLTVVVKDKKK